RFFIANGGYFANGATSGSWRGRPPHYGRARRGVSGPAAVGVNEAGPAPRIPEGRGRRRPLDERAAVGGRPSVVVAAVSGWRRRGRGRGPRRPARTPRPRGCRRRRRGRGWPGAPAS